jgi:hypothetical protein
MTCTSSFRMMSGSGVSWWVRVGATGTTTARWQDKRAHIARRSVGWFSWAFFRAPHIVSLWRNVCHAFNLPDLLRFPHIAERCHGR